MLGYCCKALHPIIPPNINLNFTTPSVFPTLSFHTVTVPRVCHCLLLSVATPNFVASSLDSDHVKIILFFVHMFICVIGFSSLYFITIK